MADVDKPPFRSRLAAWFNERFQRLSLMQSSLLVGAVAVVGVLASFLMLSRLSVSDPKQESSLEVLKVALAVVAAAGAAFALVVSYRKQRRAELDAHDADARVFSERFGIAAQQLGDHAPTVRLAGVYAMAALADEHPAQRQQCVDVLCGVLRMPTSGDDDRLSSWTSEIVEQFTDRTVRHVRSFEGQPREREVRSSIVGVIRRHLLDPLDSTNWCYLDFDFSGAHLHDPSFDGAHFLGSSVSFRGCVFAGRRAGFERVDFANDVTDFDLIQSTASLDFRNAAILSKQFVMHSGQTSSAVLFENVKATCELFLIMDCMFAGFVSFGGMVNNSKQLSITASTFCDTLDFTGVTIGATSAWFGACTFEGSGVAFGGEFNSESTGFQGNRFRGEHASFSCHFAPGSLVDMSDIDFAATTVTFDETYCEARALFLDRCTFGPGDVSFAGMTLVGTQVSYDDATITGKFDPPQIVPGSGAHLATGVNTTYP